MHSPERSHGWGTRAAAFALATLAATASLEAVPTIQMSSLPHAEATATDLLPEATAIANQMLLEYEAVPSLEDLLYEHNQQQTPEDHLTPEGLASERFKLTFNAPSKELHAKAERSYLAELRDAKDYAEALAAANRQAARYGFQYQLPNAPVHLGQTDPLGLAMPIDLVDLPLEVLNSWLAVQLISLEHVPKELIDLANLKRVYLVKTFASVGYAGGLAQPEQKAIYINLPMIKAGSYAQSYDEQNIFPHELGHLIHARLVDKKLLNNTVLRRLALQPVDFTVPQCGILANYDRDDALTNTSEQAAAIIARLLRHEPIAPRGRTGVALTTAYILSALNAALPGHDIADYLIAMSKSIDWRIADKHSEEINQQWAACQTGNKPVVKTGAGKILGLSQ
jgi:hypothetical protein